MRMKVSNNYPPTKDYRAGMIAATAYRYPVAYQTVDVAILNDKGEILLAKKPFEKKWRFIGGFSNPERDSLEQDVRSEVKEEANIEVDGITYIGSTKIDDWRYKNETDKIKTSFFVAKYIFGRPEGGDDVAEVKWFKLNNFDVYGDTLIEEHMILWNMLIEYLKKQQKENK